MNEIDNLNELQEKRNEAQKAYLDSLLKLTHKVLDIINNLNNTGVPLFIPGDKYTVNIEGEDYSKTHQWQIYHEVRFVNLDPEEKRSYDFGSDFTLYIQDTGIKVNCGTIGTWGKEEKGQLARLHLMANLFDHEQEIIDAVEPLLKECLPLEKSYYEARYEVDKVERAIREAKAKMEADAIIAKLVPGKILAQKGYTWKWNEEENKSYKVYFYSSKERIIKVTDKTIITKDVNGYYSGNNWRKKDNYVYQLQHNMMFILDSEDQECEQPKEE